MKPYHSIFALALLILQACNNLEEANYQATQSLNAFKDDTGSAWKDLFTYKPKSRAPQAAATRYCYQFMSDIVCYDSPQPQLTARLVGVQGSEGQRMIVYQTPQMQAYQTAEPAPLFPEPLTETSQVSSVQASPFAPSGTSGKTVQSKDLPPPAASTPKP